MRISKRHIHRAFRGPYAIVADRNKCKRKLEAENRALQVKNDRLNAALILAKSEGTLKGENEMLKMFATSDALTIVDQQRKIRELGQRLKISRQNGARIEKMFAIYKPYMDWMMAKVVSMRNRTEQVGGWYRSALDANDVLQRKAQDFDKLLSMWDHVFGDLENCQAELTCPVSLGPSYAMVFGQCGHHVDAGVHAQMHIDLGTPGTQDVPGKKCPLCRGEFNVCHQSIAMNKVARILQDVRDAMTSFEVFRGQEEECYSPNY